LLYTVVCILRWGVKRETKKIIDAKKLDPKSERVMVEQLRILFRERCFGCRTRNRFHKPECPVALQLAKDWLEQDAESGGEGRAP